ncbi:hypothetical protein KFL_002090020 [Klebsormidium nitens]|uniref:Myb-like domain-containing protein n=1 Tax=Klebsormidium nitens TaxID=105231 RepID=A0A1Y1I1Q9_KLENI|nr:hypothetical protein KFL_002090020 [Klebsormidium nitens]|eukprot:GAQ84850.1 hypothetical protein KFL_002090020 [Klebsormidium nitens]
MGDEQGQAKDVATPVQAVLPREEPSDEDDDADDVDFNPLFLRESEEEESEEEEPEQDDVPAPPPQQALLDELGMPSAPSPSLLPFPQSPGGHPPVPVLGPFSPGQSAFHPFGAPLTFSPNKAHGPPDGTLDLPLSMQAPKEQGEGPAEEGKEPLDGPAKRTRAQVSLAELTWEELDTFLQDDEDDFFPGIDDDEEYARFLASISALDEQPKEQERVGAGEGDEDEDEDEDDHDFVAEEEPDEEEEDAQPLAGKRKLGRPRGSRRKKPPEAASRAAALRRPLAIKPASLEGRYQQVVCHMPTQDGRLRPVLMLKPVGAAPPPPPTVPRFTANQVGQLYCQLHEHVQLLVQLFCLTCLGPPSSRALAAQCKAFLENLVATRERVLAAKQIAFPARCFQPPCTRPSLHPHLLLDGQVTVAPWAPTVDGPVRSLLDVKPLHAVPDFLRDMDLVIAELDRKYPPEAGQGLPRALLKPLFPPNPNARPPQKPSETIRSILTNQHNPCPLPGAAWDPSLLGQPTEAGPQEAGPDRESAPGFHSVLLSEPQTEAVPARPPRSLFLEEGADAAAERPSTDTALVDGQAPKGSVLAPRGRRGVEGAIGEELLKAAKPTLVAMALVAPIVSDLVQDLFHPAFNPALFPREPAPTARLRVFSDAEDELLALGMQEFNSDWERIRQRFLPTKSVHQIVVRVKNRCSSNAPDNVVKQMRHSKTAPLSAQEKFFVDEGILHHGYDWLQLAAYVPRADPALLPKLYRQACGLKPKTWKASQIRNERRKKQRQRLATQRARQEAAAELRELATDGPLRPAEADRDSSGTESDTPPERGEAVPRPAVRGLFLAEAVAQAPPAQPEPAVFQHPPGAPAAPPPAAPTRPFWMTGLAAQQPPAKRSKGGPAPGRGQSLLPTNGAHRPLARPPLRPLATQALPFLAPRPMLQTPAAAVAHKPVHPSVPVPAPMAHPPAAGGPPLPTAHHNPSAPASNGPAARTVVIRPQARRATPVAAVPHDGPRPAGPSAGPPAKGAGTAVQRRPVPKSPVPTRTAARGGPTDRGQGPQQVPRPTAASTPLPQQTASGEEPPLSNAGPRPEAPASLPAPSASSGGRTAPTDSTRPPPPVGTVGIPQQTRPGSAQETRHSSPRAQIDTSKHAAGLERVAMPVAAPVGQAPPRATPAAPLAGAPASPKPWKTRQRQPKAVKAQQKAREAEERRRKQAARDAEKRSAQEGQRAAQEAAAAERGAANGSTAGGGQGPPSGQRPPGVTVHRLPGARGNGEPPAGAARVTHIATGHGNQGSRPATIIGAGGGQLGQSVPPIHTWAGPRPPPLMPLPPRGPAGLLHQVRPLGSLPQQPFPPVRGQGTEAAPVRAPVQPGPGASAHPLAGTDPLRWTAGNGSLGAAWSSEEARQRGAMLAMDRDELTDSDEEDTWQRNGLPHASTGAQAGGRLPVNTSTLQVQEVEEHVVTGRRQEYGGSEQDLRSSFEVAPGGRDAPGAGMPAVEMERDELTDSDDEDHVAERGTQGGSPEGGRRSRAAPVRDVEMERDELTDSDEDAAGSGGEEGGGEHEGHAAQDLIRGFLMEQDELTESDEEQGEEARGEGAVVATAGVDGRPSKATAGVSLGRNGSSHTPACWTSSLSPVQLGIAEGNSTAGNASVLRKVGALWGGALGERSLTFEKDELEDSDDDDEKGGEVGVGGRQGKGNCGPGSGAEALKRPGGSSPHSDGLST